MVQPMVICRRSFRVRGSLRARERTITVMRLPQFRIGFVDGIRIWKFHLLVAKKGSKFGNLRVRESELKSGSFTERVRKWDLNLEILDEISEVNFRNPIQEFGNGI